MVLLRAASRCLLLAFALVLIAPSGAQADMDAWSAYLAKREVQTGKEIGDLDLIHDRWLLRSRSLESVYLGFPMTRMTYDKRYILPDTDAFAALEGLFKEPKVGLRFAPDGIKLAFIGMPFEKKRKLYDLSTKTRVWAELFLDRKRIANTDVYMVNPVAFILPMNFLEGLDEKGFLARMQEGWQWRVRVYYGDEVGYVYSGPLAEAEKALTMVRDELDWRQAQKARGATSQSNLDFW
ncbi:tryptophan 7-halogenase [Cohaesibacter sp. CAU 1516]|uniref:tryptophan 7-halogenase n=1 Tax=Cohaesibacter sp. CAU 1516 TaxID=2576038 RepID=UPI001485195F|nr:tryptophan 7-halogenase [Cohaesibacter sp. CAU 1516]